MTTAAYQQLLILLRQTVNASPPDDKIRRLAKGLSKALNRYLQLQAASTLQARTGPPRPARDLAAVSASLATPGEQQHGTRTATATRPPRTD